MYGLCSSYVVSNPAIKSLHTERLLAGAVKKFGLYLQRPPEVGDFSDANLVGFIKWRRSAGMAEATVEREASKLLTLWRFAACRGLVKPPTIRVAKAAVQPPIAFLQHEVRALFRAAKTYRATIGGVPGNVLLTALLYLCYETGERIGALAAVTWNDIDLRGRWITIRSRKNGGRTLTRRISRSACRSLHGLLAVSTAPSPFGTVHRGTLYHHLESLLRLAGLPTDRRHKFHCLRRTHASYLHAAGGDARESLDHSSDDITRRYYLDTRITGLKPPISFLFNPGGWRDRLLGWVGL